MCPQSTTPDPPPPSSEEWRPITLYEEWAGTYSVSSLGRVRRETPGQGARAGHILKPSVGPGGYLRVMLSHEGQHQYFFIHRLVAWQFGRSGARDAREFRLTWVEHLNGDRTDNRPKNLHCVRQTRLRPLTRRDRTLDRLRDLRATFPHETERGIPPGALPWEIATNGAEV